MKIAAAQQQDSRLKLVALNCSIVSFVTNYLPFGLFFFLHCFAPEITVISMDADDKKTENLHILPALGDCHTHSHSNGSSGSSSNHSIQKTEVLLHKNGRPVHSTVPWTSYCAPKLGSEIFLQCQSPNVASSDHGSNNSAASEFSIEETELDELGDLLRRFGEFKFYHFEKS